jgi:hypothetical protein
VGPFRVHADYPLDGHRVLLSQLENLRKDVTAELALPPVTEMIDVYLFRDQQVYQQYMRRYFPGVVARRAMFIKSNSPGNVFAFNSPELAVDIRHECTHAVLHSALPQVPLWLDEGLAEYFEQAPEDRRGGHEHFRSVRRAARFNPWKRPRPLAALEALKDLDEMGADEYRDAWAWVHFMLHANPEGRVELQAYLAELAVGRTPRPLSERLSADFDELDALFAAHFRAWVAQQ